MSKKTQAGDAAKQDRAASMPAAPIDPFAHAGDAHWGKGGRFVVGADGKRVPVTTGADTDAEADHA